MGKIPRYRIDVLKDQKPEVLREHPNLRAPVRIDAGRFHDDPLYGLDRVELKKLIEEQLQKEIQVNPDWPYEDVETVELRESVKGGDLFFRGDVRIPNAAVRESKRGEEPRTIHPEAIADGE